MRGCRLEGDDAGVELAATLCLLDDMPGELPVAGRDRDPDQLRIVFYLQREQGEQPLTIGAIAGVEPVVGLVSVALTHRVQRQVPGAVALDDRRAGREQQLGDL